MYEPKDQLSKISDVFADDFIIYFPNAPGPLSLNEFEPMAAAIYAAFGDLRRNVIEQIQDKKKSHRS